MAGVRVAIVGAGPIGLEVAWALRGVGVEVVQFDAGQVGSTIGWWAPGTRFFSSPERIAICGVPLTTPQQDKATREEYLEYLRGVAVQFDLRVRTFERVTKIEHREEGEEVRGSRRGFRVVTQGAAGERGYEASHVVCAIGDMHRARMLGIPGETLGHVSHYLRDPHRYFRRRVVIVGGKNSAAEAAVRLHRVGAEVLLSYRGAELNERRIKYWILPELKGLIKAGKIAFERRTAPVEITGEGVRLARAEGEEAGRGSGGVLPFPSVLAPADEVLLLTGYEMDSSMLVGAGVELCGPQQAPVFNARTMETNVPRLYVAGTATAGSQVRTRVFIENCHWHGARIAAHVVGRAAPEGEGEVLFEAPES